MAVTIQLKRGTAEAWKRVNPILAVGEPGFEKDTNRLKIGDGVNNWVNLPYQDQSNENVFNTNTRYEFPSIGKENVIYKASQEAKLYQWNPTLNIYESLIGSGDGGSFDDIDLINGGNAYGNS